MLNQIVSGVVAALDAVFNDCPIYTENVEQALESPCFSVKCVTPKERQFLGKRYLKQNLICVYYFPSPDGGNHERNDVIEKLFSTLEYITCDGDLIRGTNLEAHVEDGVVVFNVNYDFFVHKTPQIEDNMEEYEVKGEVHE